MSEDLHDLYQDIILDHNKHPRHYGVPEYYTHTAEGYNPLCGDRVNIFLVLKEKRIVLVQFEAACCAICRASASIMANTLYGESLDQIRNITKRVHELLFADLNQKLDLAANDEIVALAGVRKFPARIKCAVLPWYTYEAALKGEARLVIE